LRPSAPFEYRAKGKTQKLSYWRMVAEAYDEPEMFRRWATLGLDAARRSAAKKKTSAKPMKRQ
jgi:TfoX/Sxy family transcriptional regulator of competence genes